jgi:hypothetical protein
MPVQKLLVSFAPLNVLICVTHPRWSLLTWRCIPVSSAIAFTQRLTPEKIVNYRVDKVGEMPAPFTRRPDRIETMRTMGLTNPRTLA